MDLLKGKCIICKKELVYIFKKGDTHKIICEKCAELINERKMKEDVRSENVG